LEPTNPSILHPQAAWPVALGLGLAPAPPATAGTGLAPAAPRQLQLGQFSSRPSLVTAQRRAARVNVVRPLNPPEPLRLSLATPGDLEVILGLIEDARRWLKAQGRDQWAKPWPDRETRDARVLRGLVNKKTWIVRRGDTAVATLTMAHQHNPGVWVPGACECDLAQRAVYLHRLITARSVAGRGLGKWLINWAGNRARTEYGARWIRIDVWTTNTDLHRYYQKLGFAPCGRCPNPAYPSGALFQKPLPKPGGSMPLPK
jgi:GNAT superfamily N-acetyltransferase